MAFTQQQLQEGIDWLQGQIATGGMAFAEAQSRITDLQTQMSTAAPAAATPAPVTSGAAGGVNVAAPASTVATGGVPGGPSGTAASSGTTPTTPTTVTTPASTTTNIDALVAQFQAGALPYAQLLQAITNHNITTAGLPPDQAAANARVYMSQLTGFAGQPGAATPGDVTKQPVGNNVPPSAPPDGTRRPSPTVPGGFEVFSQGQWTPISGGGDKPPPPTDGAMPPFPTLEAGDTTTDPRTGMTVLTLQGQGKIDIWTEQMKLWSESQQRGAKLRAAGTPPTGAPEGQEYVFDPNTQQWQLQAIPGVASARIGATSAAAALAESQRQFDITSQQTRLQSTLENRQRTREIDLQEQKLNTDITATEKQFNEAVRQFDLTEARLARDRLTTLEQERETLQLRREELLGTVGGQPTLESQRLAQEATLTREGRAQEQQQFEASNPFAAFMRQQFGGGAGEAFQGLAAAPGALTDFKFAQPFVGEQFPGLSPISFAEFTPTEREVIVGIAGRRGLQPQDLLQMIEQARPGAATLRPRRRARRL